uniref:Epidermal growth factor receptor kinase substrate 8-like protein 2 n=1 Tax=Schistosoma haematobium TaxID=6185 RepID=A0A094ZDW6_SCHHA
MSTGYILLTDDAYGQDLYMLNRCLDDIEWFEKNFRKSFRSSPDELDNKQNSTVAIDSLQKVKYALNIIEKIRKSVPYISKEIFIYLIRIVRKVHTVAKSKQITNYNSNIVVDVIEPLLNENTITSIFKLLSVKTKELWLDLGPAWNTPSSKWPNPLNIYMPIFYHPLKKRSRHRSNEVISRNPVFNSRIVLKGASEINNEYEPRFHGGLRYFRIDDKEYLAYQRFRKRTKQHDESLATNTQFYVIRLEQFIHLSFKHLKLSCCLLTTVATEASETSGWIHT